MRRPTRARSSRSTQPRAGSTGSSTPCAPIVTRSSSRRAAPRATRRSGDVPAPSCCPAGTFSPPPPTGPRGASSRGRCDGVSGWGDSVVRLTPDAGRLLAHWTPADQARYEAEDIDVGSTSPAYLGSGLVLQGGKDAQLHLLALDRLHGVTGAAGKRLGGDLQVLGTPGGQMMFTAPAVWHHGGATTVIVTTGGGTTAYRVRPTRLVPLWGNDHAGTSPVVAGGLLFVYDPGGGLRVYDAATGRLRRTLVAGAGHW